MELMIYHDEEIARIEEKMIPRSRSNVVISFREEPSLFTPDTYIRRTKLKYVSDTGRSLRK